MGPSSYRREGSNLQPPVSETGASACWATAAWWGREDSNLRSSTRRGYSPDPLPLGSRPHESSVVAAHRGIEPRLSRSRAGRVASYTSGQRAAPAGLEPAISRSTGGRVHHYAIGPKHTVEESNPACSGWSRASRHRAGVCLSSSSLEQPAPCSLVPGRPPERPASHSLSKGQPCPMPTHHAPRDRNKPPRPATHPKPRPIHIPITPPTRTVRTKRTTRRSQRHATNKRPHASRTPTPNVRCRNKPQLVSAVV
jgi:hypothetical protein